MDHKSLVIGVLMLGIAIALSGCGQTQEYKQMTPLPQEQVPDMQQQAGEQMQPTSPGQAPAEQVPPQTTTETAQPTESGAMGGVKEFRVEAFQFSFDPDTIEVNQGDKVKITLTTRDVGHGFALRAYNINEAINPGQSTVVEFTADQKGTFPFFCSVPCGAGHQAMKGTLIVK